MRCDIRPIFTFFVYDSSFKGLFYYLSVCVDGNQSQVLWKNKGCSSPLAISPAKNTYFNFLCMSMCVYVYVYMYMVCGGQRITSGVSAHHHLV